VLVVFDAFRSTLLHDERGQVDASRFPNLAALAGQSTWYRNATTSHENTVFAVPSILDGRQPQLGMRPDLRSHPQNLFTLLERDYRLNVHEEATKLCPVRLCGRHPKGSILQRLARGRIQRFDEAVRGIRRGSVPPTLTFVHAFFPHEPRSYLPDGRAYQRGADIEPALDGPGSFTDPWLTQQSLQRTLLQTMFTDRLIGRLVRRLRDTGQWDRSLLIITADHGESFKVKRTPAAPFKPGHMHWRRAVSGANIEELAPVPLFVKYPGQRAGQTDDRFVTTLDVLPTIADVTAHPPNWVVTGRTLRGQANPGGSEVRVGKTFGGSVAMPAGRWLGRVAAARREVHNLFAPGSGEAGLFAIGSLPELHGRPLTDFRLLPRGRIRAAVTDPAQWRRVRLRSWFQPLFVTARLRGGRQAGRRIAVAVNGQIAATSWSFRTLGAKRLSIASLIPPTALRSGANDVRIYEILDANTLRRLG
jgi:hypothetical protein